MSFEEIYTGKLFGAIHGFDRLRFRGTIRAMNTGEGIARILNFLHVLLTNFMIFFKSITSHMVLNAKDYCRSKGIEYIWKMGETDKDAMAKALLAASPEGRTGPLFCLATIENCLTARLVSNREKGLLEARLLPGKCTHLYLYFNDPEYGLGHIRVQTWAPFGVHVCINGRSWLENQLRREGVKYVKAENCFPWLEDIGKAQALLDSQLRTGWPDMLRRLLDEYAPWIASSFGTRLRPEYYWSADETEFATDYMFRNQAELDRLFPMLVRYGMMASDCAAVMRFLGKRQGWQGGGNALPDLHSDSRRRHEGVRIKHYAGGNSVKAYNKQGSILRVETTINNTRSFSVFRHPDDNPARPMSWLPMRKGVADLERRAEISARINKRHADHMAAADAGERFGEVVEKVCRKASLHGRNGKSFRVRAIRPGDPLDKRLLEFLKKGDWDLNGFANRDLDMFLNNGRVARDADEKGRRSARASRLIRLLRAHGLVKKVKDRNRYTVTEYGYRLSTAIGFAENVSVRKLGEMSA